MPKPGSWDMLHTGRRAWAPCIKQGQASRSLIEAAHYLEGSQDPQRARPEMQSHGGEPGLADLKSECSSRPARTQSS